MTNLLVRLFVKDAGNTASPAVHARYGLLAGWVGIVCNLLLALGKLLAGLLSGSIAVMADAVNNFSDAASSIITLVGFKLSAKPADKEHPFGHARFEYLAGLAVAVLVLMVGVELLKSGIQKILAPQPTQFGTITLLVLAASIAVKLWMAFFNRNIGRRIGSATLQATFVDSRNDVITTTAVLAAALVARFTGLQLDGYMGAAVAVFILISGIGLIRSTLAPLLGAAPDAELVEHIAKTIGGTPGVLGTHDLIVHDYGPKRRFASAHVEMDSSMDVMQSHAIIDQIERDFLEKENLHLIIHYDPVDTGHSAQANARRQVQQQLLDIDCRLSLHDFRMTEAASHFDYTFDVVVPPDYPESDEVLRAQIEKALQAPGQKPVVAALTIDRSYAPIPS